MGPMGLPCPGAGEKDEEMASKDSERATSTLVDFVGGGVQVEGAALKKLCTECDRGGGPGVIAEQALEGHYAYRKRLTDSQVTAALALLELAVPRNARQGA